MKSFSRIVIIIGIILIILGVVLIIGALIAGASFFDLTVWKPWIFN